MATHTQTRINKGFTLIEVLIVVVILGVLAGVVIAQFVDARDDTEKVAFINSGRIFADAAARFQLEHGTYVNDTMPGELPDGFPDYINYTSWLAATPIGGKWDAELNENGIISAVGVYFDGSNNKSVEFMREIDGMFDDGDLATGFFQQLTPNRYFFVVAD